MPRMISFAMTTPQFRARTKTVTRRMGWAHLKAGDVLMGVEKAMGLGKGGTVVRLGLIQVVSVWREPLDAITQADVALEGFPDWTPQQFVEFFCAANKCGPDALVNRIRFAYLDGEPA